jgi:hypothetical protein
MLYSNYLLHCEGADIDEELTLPIQMSEIPSSTSVILTIEDEKSPRHTIIDFMKHTRRTLYSHEHRISIPNNSKL